ncbi:MAG TPA: transglutaminaseTgpA domain-containing protein [Hyalangium sp.]|nr:transglutaminaseTgpA domain-containing protein [Hyalangium sp.]
MSEAPASTSRLQWGAELLPVLATLALHALAHDRFLLCVPAAVLLIAALALGKQPTYSPRLLMISALVGGAAGYVLSELWPVQGPIPPIVMGPLCGALVGLSTLCALCGRQAYALTYALLLAALSVAVRGSTSVYVGLAAVTVSLLVTAFIRGRIAQAGLRASLAFGVFALVVLATAFGMWRFVRASEGVLTKTVFRLLGDAPQPSSLALQRDISLGRRGQMPDTQQLLMELRGDGVERLRTTVFDAFDGTQWTTSRALEQAQLKLRPPTPGEPLHSTELTLEVPLREHLPAPAGIRAVEGAAPKVLGGWVLRATGNGATTLTLRHDLQEQLPPEPPPGESLTSLPPELRAELLPFALKITRGATTPRERSQALEAWFRNNHRYSLSVDLSGEGSPLAVLIRERRPAWCTYFASAMAALLRTLDIPARLAGGFVPQEKNPFSEAWLVHSRDAHAWVEVYLPEEGRFVPFDPTPWQSREALFEDHSMGTLGAAWQAFTSALGRGFSRLVSSPAEALAAVGSSPLTWILVGAGLVWQLLVRYRRAPSSRTREAMRGADPGLAAAYARYLRVMKRSAGLVPSPAETDEELLLRLRTTQGDRAGALAEEFLTRYRQARYGGGAADPASLGVLTAELDRLLRQKR